MKWRWHDLGRGRKIALTAILVILSAYTALVVVYNLTKTDEPPKTTVATKVEPEKPVCKADGEELLGYINAERRKLGVHELRIHPKLSQSAKLKFDDMVNNKYYGHDRLDGSSYGVFIDAVGWYGYTEENLDGNDGDAELVWDNFMGSRSHYNSLTNPRFSHVGVHTNCVNAERMIDSDLASEGKTEKYLISQLTVVYVAE